MQACPIVMSLTYRRYASARCPNVNQMRNKQARQSGHDGYGYMMNGFTLSLTV